MARFTFPKIALTIILLIASTNYCFAGALKITPMQSSITGVISQKAKQRGFAANDPRYAQTISAVNGVLAAEIGTAAGAAAAVTVGAITAPAWVTVAAAVGVGAVVTVGVAFALDGVTTWLFPADSSTKNMKYNAAPILATGGLTAGGPYWVNTYGTEIYAADPLSPLFAWANLNNYAAQHIVFTSCYQSSTVQFACDIQFPDGNGNTLTTDYHASGAPLTCPSGKVSSQSGCIPLVMPTPSPPVQQPAPQTLTPQQAVNKVLASNEVNKPLNPAVLAAVADKHWRDAAAKPNYGGIPYDATNPITATDVDTYRTANPTTYPTVGDFVRPQDPSNKPFILPLSPTQTTDPVSNPSTSVNPASSQPLTNLGDDPAIGSPTLEATPTATMILQPILSLFPDFKSFVVPSHQSVCPKPVFNLFGKSIVMDAQCTLAEQQRSALYAIMALVWLIAAATIVLRA